MSAQDALSLCQALVRVDSVTPDASDCQGLLTKWLEALGFTITPIHLGTTHNLWATRGDSLAPPLVFVGHTDVVPPGPLAHWTHPPFSGHVTDGKCYGRGTQDMKGAIAAMIAALYTLPQHLPMALLITGDEEVGGPDGTQGVLQHLTAQGVQFKDVLVGEPSATKRVGDRIRIGRRGSLHAKVSVTGQQGHVAYPLNAINPIPPLAELVSLLSSFPMGKEPSPFPSTSGHCVSFKADGGATNVVPGTASAHFNWRFGPDFAIETLKDQVSEWQTQLEKRSGATIQIDWQVTSHPFLTPEDSQLVRCILESIESQCHILPEIDAGGGTSDGRFLAALGANVVELGLENDTIHQVNERVNVESLTELTQLYAQVIERFHSH